MEMNDKIFDQLISETLERQQLEDQLSQQVMETLHEEERRLFVRRWARLAGFAFGVPFVLICFVAGMYYVYTHVQMPIYVWLSIALSAIVVLGFLGKEVKDFSISEV